MHYHTKVWDRKICKNVFKVFMLIKTHLFDQKYNINSIIVKESFKTSVLFLNVF